VFVITLHEEAGELSDSRGISIDNAPVLAPAIKPRRSPSSSSCCFTDSPAENMLEILGCAAIGKTARYIESDLECQPCPVDKRAP
jgi:hypothetical protein